MFSLNEVNHVAWLLVGFIAVWLALNALVDLSIHRGPLSDSNDAAKKPLDKRD